MDRWGGGGGGDTRLGEYRSEHKEMDSSPLEVLLQDCPYIILRIYYTISMGLIYYYIYMYIIFWNQKSEFRGK